MEYPEPDKEYTCPVCSKEFHTIKAAKGHMLRHPETTQLPEKIE